jgi:uncharacterized protein (TIGR02600 family)
MKRIFPLPLRSSPFLRLKKSGGFALVLVLGVLVLIMILMTGFMAKSRSERASSAGYRASAEARQMGDIAVNLVQGQINHATTQGSLVAWVSQPGMIRTFDTSGSLVNAYKLYSASNLITNSGDVSGDISTTWKDNVALWVDLNAPVTANGAKNFPIADPAALNDLGSVQGLGPGSTGGEKGFNIIDPATRAAALAPGVTSNNDYQILPMPVRWLYILRDGKLVAAVAGSTENSANIPDATEANPVVGRIAFWTDDETAKVNINTAGEGVFWDTPRGYTPTEVLQLSIKQPWNGEFNRYPGHPATVSLSAIFPLAGYNPNTLPLDSTSRTRLSEYLSLSPAYAFGGSEGGNILLPPDVGATAFGSTILAMDRKSERLYSSIDELLFAKDRSPNKIITNTALESRKFFLSASSRAPETNLFNLPRIAIWPVQDLTDSNWERKTNPFDRLIAFCASLKGPSGNVLPNYFQRTNADTRRDLLDIPRNLQLYEYLKKLTEEPIPGFGGNFLTKYNFAGERDQILTQIFDYVRTANLYDALLDFQNDGVTPVAGLDASGNPIKGVYTFTDSSAGVEGSPGFGQANPSLGPNNTLGLGRYFTIKQFMLVFIACADEAVPLSNDSSETAGTVGGWSVPWINPMLKEPYPSGPLVPLIAGQRRVQLMVLPQLFNAMAGMNNLNPAITVEVKGMEQFRLGGNDLKLGAGTSAQPTWSYFQGSSQAFSGGGLWDPEYEYKAMFTAPGNFGPGKWTTGNVVPVPPTNTNFAFISAPVTVSGSTMSFTGGTITVNIYSGQGVASARLMQSINIVVPNGSFPVPALASTTDPRFWSAFNHSDASMYPTAAAAAAAAAFGQNVQSWGRARQRFNAATSAFPGEPIRTTSDVIRAMIPNSNLASDFRLITAIDSNTQPYFAKHPDWDNTGVLNASFFSTGSGAPSRAILQGGSMRLESISSSAPYSGAGAVNVDATGDFDLGSGGFVKGSLANKPDEGDMFREPNTNWAGITPDGGTAPYFQGNRQAAAYAAFYSPNRVMPSPVMLGSLPTGVKEQVPWRTLLFRPLAQLESTHRGAISPHDSLLLDLFWMPVVEPYAISDRLSTAGKINMNYQIMPFTYIERTAPIRAVLKAERISQMPMTYAYNNRIFSGGPGATFPSSTTEYRKVINADETLKQFEERFDQTNKNTNVFISPSEICQQYLISQGDTYTSKAALALQWNQWRQTGDNLRERPYATIYQKLTTKSNSYTVHFRAQSLKKVKGSTVTEWVENRDRVTGEYRGSTTLERFIDPNANIPDYAANPANIGNASTPTLDAFYKWRVVSNKQFAP